MKTYLIVCEATGLVKIGKGLNPKARLHNLQVGSSSRLSIAHVFDCDIEKSLHKQFKSNHEIGEWFSVAVDDVVDFVKSSEIDDLKAKPTFKQLRKIELEKRTKAMAGSLDAGKTGPKSKHKFETMEVGETKPFPDGVKTSSLRVMLSIKGAENNVKFSVSGANKTVTRIA